MLMPAVMARITRLFGKKTASGTVVTTAERRLVEIDREGKNGVLYIGSWWVHARRGDDKKAREEAERFPNDLSAQTYMRYDSEKQKWGR